MKTFSLFKRADDGSQITADQLPAHRERPWHFRFAFRGQRYSRALETTDTTEGQRRAWLKYNEIRSTISK